MWNLHLLLVLFLSLCGCLRTDRVGSSSSKNGDSGVLFIDDAQVDPLEGSAVDEFNGDLDHHSSGRGIDDEDAPGSGLQPDEDDELEGSGRFPIESQPPKVHRPPPTSRPFEVPVKKPEPTKKPTYTAQKEKESSSHPQPPLPDENENRIPEVTKGSHETSTTKFNSGKDKDHTTHTDNNEMNNEVNILGHKQDERASSFFTQPGILAAVIGGAVVGLLCAILLVMFIVYRMRKKDEGSYALDEPKRSPTGNSFAKNHNNEFFA